MRQSLVTAGTLTTAELGLCPTYFALLLHSNHILVQAPVGLAYSSCVNHMPTLYPLYVEQQ